MLGKEVKVQGCAGVLPVFDSQAQAEQNNPESKFQIIPIEIKQ